ncbi:MAG: hypothetical protein Q7R70_04875 [Candidatus Diapherotrites archaeon]|nr:hypothetical protein [Candidatus Diapherotrites archaeon]
MPLFKRAPKNVFSAIQQRQARANAFGQKIKKFEQKNRPRLSAANQKVRTAARKNEKALSSKIRTVQKQASQQIKAVQKQVKKVDKRLTKLQIAQRAAEIARIKNKLAQAKTGWLIPKLRRRFWISRLEKLRKYRQRQPLLRQMQSLELKEQEKTRKLELQKQAVRKKKTAGIELGKAKFKLERQKLASKRDLERTQLRKLAKNQVLKEKLIEKILALQMKNVGNPITNDQGHTIARLDETPFKRFLHDIMKAKKTGELMQLNSVLDNAARLFAKNRISAALIEMSTSQGLVVNGIIPAKKPAVRKEFKNAGEGI